jgi:hypothetical protein
MADGSIKARFPYPRLLGLRGQMRPSPRVLLVDRLRGRAAAVSTRPTALLEMMKKCWLDPWPPAFDSLLLLLPPPAPQTRAQQLYAPILRERMGGTGIRGFCVPANAKMAAPRVYYVVRPLSIVIFLSVRFLRVLAVDAVMQLS